MSHEKWGEGKEGGEEGEGEQEETVAKALHGQRFPMPPYQFFRCELFSYLFSKGAAAP